MSFREESTYKILHKDCLDKARVKKVINKYFDKLMIRRGKQSPDYSLEQYEEDLLKELGLK